ncbi:MAG: transposase [Gemmatimonadaceae bacterium]|nr:transposase [Gemmatimonadaceae bacterium]
MHDTAPLTEAFRRAVLRRFSLDLFDTAQAAAYRSDKSEGPTAGTETVDPLEFLARELVHTPEKGHVTTRCYGWSASRPRGMRRQAESTAMAVPPPIVPAGRLAPDL